MVDTLREPAVNYRLPSASEWVLNITSIPPRHTSQNSTFHPSYDGSVRIWLLVFSWFLTNNYQLEKNLTSYPKLTAGNAHYFHITV